MQNSGPLSLMETCYVNILLIVAMLYVRRHVSLHSCYVNFI
uniref:Uncharacterized protein n=1 Tax=Rhizophora mucronata TaxID=61149 RepID=A0A2P2JK36_RHIMU